MIETSSVQPHDDEHEPQASERIRTAATAWKLAEVELKKLAQQETQLLAAGTPPKTIIDTPAQQFDAMQASSLGVMLTSRSQTLDDVCTKLGVWLAQNSGPGCSESDFTPTDQLAAQAIRELMGIVDSSDK